MQMQGAELTIHLAEVIVALDRHMLAQAVSDVKAVLPAVLANGSNALQAQVHDRTHTRCRLNVLNMLIVVRSRLTD